METSDLKGRQMHDADGATTGRIDALAMLHASRNDPEMAIPERPAFLPGGVFSIFDDVMIVDGGAARQVLNGSAATSLIPRLIKLLDGKHTVPEIADQLGTAAVQVEAAIALMSACGLIVPSLDVPDHLDVEVANALGRHLDTTKRWSSAAEAYRAAFSLPAYIINNGRLSEMVAESLKACGDSVFLVDTPLEVTKEGYIVAVGASEAVLSEAVKNLNGQSSVVKLCGLYGDRIWVAPTLTNSGQTACWKCMLSAISELQLLGETDNSTPSLRLAASLIALEVFHDRLGIGRPLASNSLLVHNLSVGHSSQLMIPRTAGCLECGIPGQRGNQGWPFIYDQAAVFPARSQVAMKGHQMHYKPANLALQWMRREFKHSAHQRFSAEVDWQHPIDPRAVLGAMLRYAFGLRATEAISEVLRFSPTGGNLGSPEGFFVVRDVDDVVPGAYCYLPFEDKSAFLGTVSENTLLRSIDDVNFQAIVVLTASLERVEKKYHSLALRICLLDAGVAVSQLCHVANALGAKVSIINQWDDDSLKEMLHLGEKNPIMAVVGLNGLKITSEKQ